MDRTDPIRSWSTLFQAPGTDGRRADDPAKPSGKSTGGSVDDVVTRSVELGYRLVDEYIRQGERAARRVGERSYSPQTFSSDMQDLAARMTQYASDFVRLWVEMFQLAASGGLYGTGMPANAGFPAAGKVVSPSETTHGNDMPPDTRVVIEVVSAQAIETSLELRPDASRRNLVVHALRAVDPDKPRISSVTFQPANDGEPARLRVEVPEGLPPGLYSGLLVEEQTNRPVGTLTVQV